MADNILAVNDGNFEVEVLTASKTQPVMVDFLGGMVPPCHMLAPTVAEIARTTLEIEGDEVECG